MTWFRVDDGFNSHPKVLAAGPAAVGLWTIAGSWSCANLTDGFVPDYALPRLAEGARELAETLVSVGLWRRARGGYRFHDWSEYQLTSESVREERQKWADKKARQRAAKKVRQQHRRSEGLVSPGDIPGDTTGDSPGESPPMSPSSHSHPHSTSPNGEVTTSSAVPPTAPKPEQPQRLDVERICTHLADRIEGNGSKRPAITDRWRTEGRLLLDKDGRTVEQVIACIDWCQADGFWRANVLSMPKLREKYDQLRLAAQRERPAAVNGGHQSYRNPTDMSVYEEKL